MTIEQFGDVLAGTGLPVVYLSYGANDVPDMPFITYFEEGSDNFGADGKVYHNIREMRVDLWSVKKDIENEALIESALDAAGIFWNKECEADDDEHCQRTIYTMEV